MRGNQVEITDANELLDVLYNYLSDNNLIGSGSLKVEYHMKGWYCGYNKNS